MGANLVAQALTHWTHVSDRAFRVLIRMALTALDNPSKGRPAATYMGGRDLLAMSLRGDTGTPETRYRAVKRALAELTEAGAIKHLQAGWAGQNAVYRLTLERREMGGPTSPPKGGLKSPPMGGPSGSKRGVLETPPRNQEETQDERWEEEVADLETASHPPRAIGSSDPENVISSEVIERRRSQREAGRDEISAKAANARGAVAALEARRKAAREAN